MAGRSTYMGAVETATQRRSDGALRAAALGRPLAQRPFFLKLVAGSLHSLR
jgi:hypothetical protein